MNKLKKLASLVLALVMALALAAPAFAANPLPTATITAPNNGHTYEVYQIFIGDYDPVAKNLSNVKWGANGTSTTGDVDDSILETLGKANGSDLDVLKVIEQYWDKNSTPVATIGGDGYPATTTQTTGYYLFKDITDPLEDGDSVSINVVMLVNDIEIKDKTNTNTFEKKLKDTDDALDATHVYTDWQDSADYDLNDTVPFQLKATLGNNIHEYDEYYVEFQDELSAGLKYDANSLVIKIVTNGVEKVVTDDFDKDVNETANGTTMSFKCENVKDLGATDGSVIIVEYNAQLTGEGVEYGSTGNPNEAQLIYSRKPGSDEKGKTPKDKVTVFTFKLEVSKVDENNEALEGAGFTLFKWVYADNDEQGEWKQIGDEIGGEQLTSEFEWKGIDAGKYKLVETTTPPGYNTIDDIEFTVEAEHSEGDAPALTSLVIKDKDGKPVSGPDAEKATFTAELTSGAVATDVMNKKGAELPSTGGIGTTIFYVVGGVLAAGAVILLITKRRMNINK